MATYTVDTLLDELDGDYTAGDLSLREAINVASVGDTINFDTGLAGGSIVLTLGELALTQDVIIDGDVDGDNKADITISGNNSSRIFNITGATTDVDLLSLTLSNGSSSGSSGGAVKATMASSLDIADTTIIDSTSTNSGGGLSVTTTTSTITNSLFRGNFASFGGGGAHFSGSAIATVTNSTFHDNTTNGVGGAVYLAASTLNLNNSTVTSNHADANGVNTLGGGIGRFMNSFVNLDNSVVAENTSGTGFIVDDAFGDINNSNNSFLGTNESILAGSNNINNGGDPLLAALADNGGTVQTQNILVGSQLINAGENASIPAGTTTDANGNARIISTTVDIGATEFTPVVTSIFDEEADAGTLAGDMADGAGLSLREALAYASDGDMITFDASHAGQTLLLTRGEMVITQDITIDGDTDGDDKADIIIDGDAASRIFHVSGTSNDLTLNSLTITNAAGGSAVHLDKSAGDLTLINSTISNSNQGGIYAKQSGVYLHNSVIYGNHSAYDGGAIRALGSPIKIVGSTIYGNSSDQQGGGISGDTYFDGAVFSFTTISLKNSTLTENQADANGASANDGGGIAQQGATNTITLHNSVVAGNTSGSTYTADDVLGVISSARHSFIGSNEVITNNTNSINNGGDPLLAALADNGGTVQSQLVLVGSQLIGGGDATELPLDVVDLDNDGDTAEFLPIDANGNARVQGVLDIGAVEVPDGLNIIVDTIVDENDGDFSTGDLSLREALGLVQPGGTITFDATLSGQTITLGGTELTISQDVTIDGDIDGDNKADITIDGNAASRILNISGATTDVTLNSLTLTNGTVVGFGGAILANSASSLTMVDSTISNSTSTVSGGAIRAFNTEANLYNTTINGNSSGAHGGGISVRGADLIVVNSTIAGNEADGFGGGIDVDLVTSAKLYNSTIADNQAAVGNVSVQNGGGVSIYNSTLSTYNTVVVRNTSGTAFAPDDVTGTISNAYNSFLGTSEFITTSLYTINGGGDPLLDILADNGGTVQTIQIRGGSQLIGAGNAALLPADTQDLDGDANTAEPLPVDANGNARIQDVLDIGAVEVADGAPLVVDNIIDENDGDFSVGDLSLREALASVAVGGTIVFDASLSGQSIILTLGELALSQDITIDGDIDGDDKADITIDGNATSRIFNISGATSDVVLQSLTLTNGNSGGGGAILANNASSLTVINSTVSNSYTASEGGAFAISNTALSLINTLVANNSAGDYGGGISLNNFSGGDVSLVNTTFYGNTTGAYGGGLYILNGNNLAIDNSTISGNRSTIGTTYTSGGSGLRVGGGTNVILQNSVIAGNFAGTTYAPDDIEGTIDTVTNSFIGVAGTITTNTNTANGGGDAGLEALADNGGTTQTLAIAVGSALFAGGDAGLLPADTTDLDNDGNSAEDLPVDANGSARILQGLDIGAVESFNFVVDTIVDEDDGDFSAGDLSLREAIGLAGIGGTITFDASLSGQTIVLGGTDLSLTQDVTIDGDIDGDDKADISIDGNAVSRIFEITGATTDVDLLSLTLQNGYTADRGGAILADFIATLDVSDTTISNNTSSGFGGGIMTQSTDVTFTNVLLSGNHAGSGGGGAAFGISSTAILTNTTIDDNSSNSIGGGVYSGPTSTLTLNNSTVTNNLADVDGSSSTSGGGLSVLAGNTINNSVIAGNTSGGALPTAVADDVLGTIVTANNSFFGTTEIITNDFLNNNGGGDPLLGELLNNGGTTLTRSPLDGSPLIGTGSNAVIPADTHDIDNDGNTAEDLPLDGRGGARLVGGNVDIGAVEQIVDEVIGGTDGVNYIVGGDGDDVLEGLAGADVIDGGAHGAVGDTAGFDGSSGAVQIDLDAGTATGGHAAGDVLTNIENLIGSRFGDILTGNNDANLIDGALGNDTLSGLGGNDVLIGGFNHDTLNGGDGDDDLEGKEGNDIIDGGAGADTGRFDSFGGAVIINLNLTAAQNTGAGGTDTITNVENLIGGIGNDRFTGKVQASVLEGGGGSDSLFGLGGDDILRGGEGNDNAQGGNGIDTLIGGNGRDTLVGGAGNDTIQGDAGKDVIRGGNDEDIINGGAGRDVLIGGDFTGGGFPGDGAADTFVFSEVSDSAFGGATRDIIRDFEQTLDIIDLSAIDAVTGGGNDTFTFIGTSGFSGAAGELRAFSVGGNTTVRGDVDGDGVADLEIFINGVIAMTAGDFVL